MARYLSVLFVVISAQLSITADAKIMKCVAADGSVTYADSCTSGDQATEMHIDTEINTMQSINTGSGSQSGTNVGTGGTTIVSTGGDGDTADQPTSSGGGTSTGTSGGGGSSGASGGGGGSAASGGGGGSAASGGGDTPDDGGASGGGGADAPVAGDGTDTPVTDGTGNDGSGSTATGGEQAPIAGSSSNTTSTTDTADTSGSFTAGSTIPGNNSGNDSGTGDTTSSIPPVTDTGSNATVGGDNTSSPPPSADDIDTTPDLIFVSQSPGSEVNYTVESLLIDPLNKEITINGNNFGDGPNVILFDRFDNGVTGEMVPLTNSNNPACSADITGLNTPQGQGPLIGCWTEYGSNRPRYSSIAYSGSHSMKSRDNTIGMLQIKKGFDKITEMFVSFYTITPKAGLSPDLGDFFPGEWWLDANGIKTKDVSLATEDTFSEDSSWKMTWLLQDGKFDTLSANLVLPSYTGSKIFHLQGNDNSVADLGSGDKWWSWINWNRVSTWIRANTADPTGPGEFIFQAVSLDKGFFQLSSQNTPIFDTDGPAEKYFNSINVPGWLRENSNSTPLYDDIYIAIGPNAVSRVEIGNASTYHSSNRIQILRIGSWNNTQIRVLFDDDSNFVPGSDAYLYITDNNGRVNLNGFSLD